MVRQSEISNHSRYCQIRNATNVATNLFTTAHEPEGPHHQLLIVIFVRRAETYSQSGHGWILSMSGVSHLGLKGHR